jgi:hypothetical protein
MEFGQGCTAAPSHVSGRSNELNLHEPAANARWVLDSKATAAAGGLVSRSVDRQAEPAVCLIRQSANEIRAYSDQRVRIVP